MKVLTTYPEFDLLAQVLTLQTQVNCVNIKADLGEVYDKYFYAELA